MPVKTSRADGAATVTVDHQRCIGCQLCISVCKGAPLYWNSGKVEVDQARGFGCIACGHCVAVCPQECITVEGRSLSASDVCKSSAALPLDYEQQYNLMQRRRSVRNFTEQEVGRDIIEKILAAAATAPIGVPPSEVSVSVVAGRDLVKAFATDLVCQIRRTKWLFSSPMRVLLRVMMGKEAYQSFTSFVPVLFNTLDQAEQRGEDWLFYNAPLVMIFHAASFGEPVDAHIAATYAVITAESLGLGSCMIGSVAPLLKNGRQLKEKYGIPAKNKTGLAVIFGYPSLQYRRTIKRTFANVTYV